MVMLSEAPSILKHISTNLLDAPYPVIRLTVT